MADDPKDILNWRRVDGRITLSGQPTPEQFGALACAGVQHIINLAPYDNANALPEEAEILAGLGLRYTYIPVDFDAPTDADFDAFCTALAQSEAQAIHVHCIYNARVSAFMLRRAQEGRGGDVSAARALMDSIWRPRNVWADFLGEASVADDPHLYAGYDYEPDEAAPTKPKVP